jgi:hypothetical protein
MSAECKKNKYEITKEFTHHCEEGRYAVMKTPMIYRGWLFSFAGFLISA